MVKELVDHLGTFDRNLVERAVTKAIGKSEQWPAIAVIVGCVNELRDLPPAGRPAWRDSDDGERFHANSAEEVARRAAQCLAWRRQYGFNAQAVKSDGADDDLESLNRLFTEAELESAKRLTAGKAREE